MRRSLAIDQSNTVFGLREAGSSRFRVSKKSGGRSYVQS